YVYTFVIEIRTKNDLNQQTNNGNGYDDAQSVLIVYTLFFENTASFGIDQRIFFNLNSKIKNYEHTTICNTSPARRPQRTRNFGKPRGAYLPNLILCF